MKLDELLHRRFELSHHTLALKGKEYASNHDRLHNFHRASQYLDCTPERALLGMLVKHWVSIEDLVTSTKKIDREIIDEKIGDAVNYLLLFEHMKLYKNDNNYTLDRVIHESFQHAYLLIKKEPAIFTTEEKCLNTLHYNWQIIENISELEDSTFETLNAIIALIISNLISIESVLGTI